MRTRSAVAILGGPVAVDQGEEQRDDVGDQPAREGEEGVTGQRPGGEVDLDGGAVDAGPFAAELDDAEEQPAQADDDQQVDPSDFASGRRGWWRSPRRVAGSCDSSGDGCTGRDETARSRIVKLTDDGEFAQAHWRPLKRPWRHIGVTDHPGLRGGLRNFLSVEIAQRAGGIAEFFGVHPHALEHRQPEIVQGAFRWGSAGGGRAAKCRRRGRRGAWADCGGGGHCRR